MSILKQHILGPTIVLFLFCFVTYAAAEYANGKLGKALILDGSSHTVKIPHYAGLKPAKAITVSAWIKPERVGKGGWQWQEIYRKEDGNARALMAIGEYEEKHSLCFGLGIGGKFVEHGAPLEPAELLQRNFMPSVGFVIRHPGVLATIYRRSNLNGATDLQNGSKLADKKSVC